MKLVSDFIITKVDEKMRNVKDSDLKKKYLILECLDEQKNFCKFFVFDDSLVQKILDNALASMQEVTFTYEVVFANDNWRVRLVDVDE